MMKNEIINQRGRSMIEMLGVLAIVGVLSVGGIAGYSKAMQKYRVNKTIDQITQISNGIHTLYTARNNYEGLDIALLGKAKVIPPELVESSEIDSSLPQELDADTLYNDAYGAQMEEYNNAGCDEYYPVGECVSWAKQILDDQSLFLHDPTAWLNNKMKEINKISKFHGTNPFGGKILLSVEDNAKAFSLNYLGLPEDACIDVLTQDWGTTDLIAVGVDSSITSTQGCTGIKGTHVCNDQLPVSVEKAMDFCATQNDSKGVILKFK